MMAFIFIFGGYYYNFNDRHFVPEPMMDWNMCQDLDASYSHNIKLIYG